MYPIISRRWFLYLCICMFMICKLRDLNLAFYWIESWVYAPAVKLMYTHGPASCPMPYPWNTHVVTRYCSRLCVRWMKVFGLSNVAMHSFPLFLSVVLAMALYEIMLRLFWFDAANTMNEIAYFW